MRSPIILTGAVLFAAMLSPAGVMAQGVPAPTPVPPAIPTSTPTPVPVPPPNCTVIKKDLRIGDRSREVGELHKALVSMGFRIANSEVEGRIYGEGTASAVSGFQQRYSAEILAPAGLEYGTGLFGKVTREKFNQICRGPARIDVVYPRGGENFPVNRAIQVGWTANFESQSVRIRLYSPEKGDAYVSPAMRSKDGENRTTIPANRVRTPGIYMVIICDETRSPENSPGKNLCGISKPFTIGQQSTISLSQLTPASGPVGTRVRARVNDPRNGEGVVLTFWEEASNGGASRQMELKVSNGEIVFQIPSTLTLQSEAGNREVSVKQGLHRVVISNRDSKSNIVDFMVSSGPITLPVPPTSTPATSSAAAELQRTGTASVEQSMWQNLLEWLRR